MVRKTFELEKPEFFGIYKEGEWVSDQSTEREAIKNGFDLLRKINPKYRAVANYSNKDVVVKI